MILSSVEADGISGIGLSRNMKLQIANAIDDLGLWGTQRGLST